MDPAKPHIISPWDTYTIMDPSWSLIFVGKSGNSSREPVPTASSQSGLHIVPDWDTESHDLIWELESLKEALCACNKDHKCKEQIGLTVPTRLLYVGRHGTDEIRVAICSEEPELIQRPPAAYATLSYCWGTYPALKSTQSNLDSRKLGFSISEMPRTLRDAVRVTRNLGLLYLWVDALCILQDCEEDWQRESKRMAEVYGHAFVTIFAFGARDCDGGLFSPADQNSPSDLSWDSEPQFLFRDEPLNHRAWALQEWHLSPRRLIFTSYDAIFDCFEGPKQNFGYGVYSQRLLSSSALNPRDWNLLVMNYSSRELTNPADKLPAISALAQKFDELSNGQNGRYLAGLWEAHLPGSLLWHRNRLLFILPQPNPARPTAYRAPTWSWASINGTVEFVVHAREWDVVTHEINVDLRPAGNSDPSRPMIYTLGLRSQMKSLKKECLEETDSHSTTREESTDFLLRPQGTGSQSMEDTAGRIWGDCSMRPFKEGQKALKFCAIMADTVRELIWGLLLVEVDHGSFERIGCGWCLSSWFEDAEVDFVEIT